MSFLVQSPGAVRHFISICKGEWLLQVSDMFLGPACKLKFGPDHGSFRNSQWSEKRIVSESVLCLRDLFLF